MDQKLYDLAQQWGQILLARGMKCTTAESCTGGGVAQAITAISGSSDWFDRGFVTYSNAAKAEMLGVPEAVLAQFGAVSEETVRAMAEGAVAHSQAQVSIAVSGIAGPSGGTVDKPVGLVWFAWVIPGQGTLALQRLFTGDRESIRQQSVYFALSEVCRQLAKVI